MVANRCNNSIIFLNSMVFDGDWLLISLEYIKLVIYCYFLLPLSLDMINLDMVSIIIIIKFMLI